MYMYIAIYIYMYTYMYVCINIPGFRRSAAQHYFMFVKMSFDVIK